MTGTVWLGSWSVFDIVWMHTAPFHDPYTVQVILLQTVRQPAAQITTLHFAT